MINRKTFFGIVLVVVILISTCELSFASVCTSKPFIGVTLNEIVHSKPVPEIIHLAIIDTTAPGIHFLITPGNGDPNGQKPGDPNLETTRETTLQFVKKQHAQIGINASFFRFEKDTLNTNDHSLVVSNGHVVSPIDKDYNWIINLTQKDKPHICFIKKGDAKRSYKLYNAVAGSNLLVQGGKNIAPNWKTRAPRTAAGINSKGDLLLVTVDGRQPGVSKGMSLHELAAFLVRHGAVMAINLDGGGSTTMVIADPKARVLNFPSDPKPNGRPGQLRKVGTSLAVFAKPNPNYNPIPSLKPYSQHKPSKHRQRVKHRTILDGFEHGLGHFDSMPATASHGLDPDSDASSSKRVKVTSQAGHWSQKTMLIADNNPKTNLFVRYLSGHGNPANNDLMGNKGYVGFFLKTNSKGLTVSIALDDQVSAKTNHDTETEQSKLKKIIADGQWHLYQWNIADHSQWSNFNQGDGLLEGSNTTINSILFQKNDPSKGQVITIFLDTVAYNPNGLLNIPTRKN